MMIFEFVGFDAYQVACEADMGLLGFNPMDTALWLGISGYDVLQAVQDGVLDLCRIINLDGSVQLIVPLASICRFRWPYQVMNWKQRRKLKPRCWQLRVLQADQERGAWFLGFAPAPSVVRLSRGTAHPDQG